MVKFAYSNSKNTNIGHIFFKLYYSYYFYIFFENDINIYLRSYFVNKLSKKLRNIILICQ